MHAGYLPRSETRTEPSRGHTGRIACLPGQPPSPQWLVADGGRRACWYHPCDGGTREGYARPPMEARALRRSLLVLLAVVAAVLATGPGRNVLAAATFRVIVNPDVKGSQMPRAALSAIFLKQALKWGDGRPVVPVDQSVQSAVRRAFSTEVLKQGIVEVQVYWQRKITAGQLPPPVKTSDEDVVAFVASTPGAIGYVSPTMTLPPTVREVTVVD